jgi:hypothetical protein
MNEMSAKKLTSFFMFLLDPMGGNGEEKTNRTVGKETGPAVERRHGTRVIKPIVNWDISIERSAQDNDLSSGMASNRTKSIGQDFHTDGPTRSDVAARSETSRASTSFVIPS